MKLKWSGDLIYMILFFWCSKTKNMGVFLCLSLFVVFFYDDLATLTLYRRAHERS